MSTSFGKEVGLIHEVILQTKKYGADETLWKALFDDRQFLTHTIDYAAFYHGIKVQFRVENELRPALRTVAFVCFAQTDWVGHEEVVSRVERFGKFAMDEDLKTACEKLQELWDIADCPKLQFPIVACSPEDIRRHDSFFWGITYGTQGGRPTLSKLDSEKQRRADRTFYWAPGTMFAVICDKLRTQVDFDRVPTK